MSAAQAVKNMQRREEQRGNARMIRRVNDKLRSGSVTMVLAPDEDGTWTERTEKHKIETALLQENERRFNQANDTPFLVPTLYDLIGPLGFGLTCRRSSRRYIRRPSRYGPLCSQAPLSVAERPSSRPSTAYASGIATG
jgi:hypothetical protein